MSNEVLVQQCDLCNEYFKNVSRLKDHVLNEHFEHQMIEPKCETVEILDEMSGTSETFGKISVKK